MKYVVKNILIQSEVLGRGNDELGELIMSNFLRLLVESPDKPASLIFWNTGVKLVCEGSWALVHLEKAGGAGGGNSRLLHLPRLLRPYG